MGTGKLFIALTLLWAFLATSLSLAAPYTGRPVGIEFEFAGRGAAADNSKVFGYAQILKWVRAHFRDRSEISVAPWNRYANARNTIHAEYRDPLGRRWRVMPEQVNSKEFDGYEFVTPPLRSEEEFVLLDNVLGKAGGLYAPGERSSTHFTYDMTHLIQWNENALKMKNQNISAVVDTILFTENHWPEIYRRINPARYGLKVNGYAVPLAADQPGLLRDLAAMPREKRTYENVRNLFLSYHEKEAELTEGRVVRAWKFRAANYGKFFGLGEFDPLPVFEYRISDLVTDPEELRARAAFFSSLVENGHKLEPGASFRDPFRAERFTHRDHILTHEELKSLSAVVEETRPEKADAFLGRLARASEPKRETVVDCAPFYAKFGRLRFAPAANGP